MEDDDIPALILTPPSATLAEGGEAATYTVVLATLPTADVTVTVGNPDEGAVTTSPVVLTFTPGNWNTPQPVTVSAVEDDDTNDEAVTLAHPASGGGYDGLEADFTATVTDDDVPRLQREILARVGQTLLAGAVDAVTERVDSLMSDICEPIDTYELGGYTIGGGSLDPPALPRTGAPASYDPRALLDDTQALKDDTLGTAQLLDGSSFRLSLGATEDVEDCVEFPRVTLWGEGSYRELSGGGGGSPSWNGDLLGARLGVDLWAHEQWLAGLALGWADGTFDWTLSADSVETADTGSGAYGIALTSLHPYVGWRSLEGDLGLWGMLGYGWGHLDLASISARRDLRMTSAALGLVRHLATSTTLLPGGTTTLRGKGEWALGRLSVDEHGLADAGAIATQRLRGLLEVDYERPLDDGDRVSPSVALGLRYDGGDTAGRGLGLETSVELTYEAPRHGLTVSGRGHLLVAYRADHDYEEWGGDVRLRIDRDPSGRGLSVSVTPAYGASASNVDGLWSRGVSSLSGPPVDNSARLETEVAYGFATLGGRGLVTPYGGLSVESGSRRHVRVGGRFELDLLRGGRERTLTLSVEGRYGEQVSGASEGAVLLKGHVAW